MSIDKALNPDPIIDIEILGPREETLGESPSIIDRYNSGTYRDKAWI